jgi:hypothetical protein
MEELVLLGSAELPDCACTGWFYYALQKCYMHKVFQKQCKEEGDASGRDRGQKRGVEGVLAQLEEIFSKSMDESSNAT